MENYIYETESGLIGYFQVQGNFCRHYPYNYKALYIDGGDWSVNFDLERLLSDDPDNYVITEERIHDAISRKIESNPRGGNKKVIKTLKVNDAGCYYPRINRNEPGLSEHQINSNARADEIRAFENITESLIDIFRTIEPEPANFKCYGNRLREQLIVACTEVEYLLQRAVVENGRKPQNKGRYNTVDYFWCLSFHKLNDYVVTLPAYPSLGSFSPFKDWSAPKYTRSLFWYDAYNKVKHDRGTTKHLATFECLINSIAAIHILLESQYGMGLFQYRFQHTFRTIFSTLSRPSWKSEDICSPVLEREQAIWETVKFHP